MKTIQNISFSGKRALIRVDFNVPLHKETLQVTDNTRIVAALPTIQKILNDGGSVVLMSHLGRPKGTYEEKYSLKHVLSTLGKLLGTNIIFANDCISPESFEKSKNLKAKEVLLLENLRFYKEEEKGDRAFAEKLSKHGDIYVNDAFGTAHRSHASTTIVADFFKSDKKYFGFLMAKEVENLRKILNNPTKPFTAIVGGAKVSDKIKVLESLTKVADNIIIGGAMAFTFIKAQGGNIGKSLCEEEHLNTAINFLNHVDINNMNNIRNIKVHLPIDVQCTKEFTDSNEKTLCDINKIDADLMGLDIGTKSIIQFKEIIAQSKSILWNGPMGVFEFSNFEEGTKQIAIAVADATQSNKTYSVIGGGDSVAAIHKFHLENNVSFISTGGGAMLEFIENGSLPGIDAIEKEKTTI